MTASETVGLTATDGARLAARFYAPDTEPEACLVIGPAMGVKQRFYTDFAEWLAARGIAVLSFDYRGIGESAHGRLRDLHADIQTWGEADQAAAIRWLRVRLPDAPLFILGHSLGGQLLGLTEATVQARGLIAVTTGSGYWGHWPTRLKPAMLLLWYVLIPVLTPILGYFPASWFGLGQDLPAGVAKQWARWGRHPDYLAGGHADTRTHHHRIRAPLLIYGVAGDWLAPRAATEALAGWFRDSEVELREIRPDQEPVPFGHFDFFRAGAGEAYWTEVLDWIRSRL